MTTEQLAADLEDFAGFVDDHGIGRGDESDSPMLNESAARLRDCESLLRDFATWFDGWCPSNKCCARTGLPIHERAIALLKRS